jgi:hypothetical protein
MPVVTAEGLSLISHEHFRRRKATGDPRGKIKVVNRAGESVSFF